MTKKLTNKEKRIRSMVRRIERSAGLAEWTEVRDAHSKAHSVSKITATHDWDDAFWRIHDAHRAAMRLKVQAKEWKKR